MSELEKVGEQIVEKAAIAAREWNEKRIKVHDYGAVKLLIRVSCHIGLQEYAPALRVIVNTTALPDQLNLDASGPRNQLTTWHTLPIKADGIDPISVTLVPTGRAAHFFRTGKTKKQRFSAAYTRNELEVNGERFDVPPKGDRYSPHVLEIIIEPKRRGFLGMSYPDNVPKEWEVPEVQSVDTTDR